MAEGCCLSTIVWELLARTTEHCLEVQVSPDTWQKEAPVAVGTTLVGSYEGESNLLRFLDYAFVTRGFRSSRLGIAKVLLIGE